jgi:hypothetical protein
MRASGMETRWSGCLTSFSFFALVRFHCKSVRACHYHQTFLRAPLTPTLSPSDGARGNVAQRGRGGDSPSPPLWGRGSG